MLIRYFAQYGEEPDSAYGEEVYVHAPTLESAGECTEKQFNIQRQLYHLASVKRHGLQGREQSEISCIQRRQYVA